MAFLSSKKIVGGINRKDPDAQSQVYAEWHNMISNLVGERLNYSYATEDLASEAFVRLFQQPVKFTRLKKVQRFIQQTAINLCADYKRHLRVVSAYADNYRNNLGSEEEKEDPVDPEDPEGEEIAGEFKRRLIEAVQKLPKKQKEIVRLYSEGLKNTEIAAKMKLSEKTVANLRSMALKNLKLELGRKSLLRTINLFL